MSLLVEKVFLRRVETYSYVCRKIPITLLADSLIREKPIYRSEQEWSALAPALAARPPASPTKSECFRSIASSTSAWYSSRTSRHIPVRGFRNKSLPVAAKRVIGRFSCASIVLTFVLNVVTDFKSLLALLLVDPKLSLPWFVRIVMSKLDEHQPY